MKCVYAKNITKWTAAGTYPETLSKKLTALLRPLHSFRSKKKPPEKGKKNERIGKNLLQWLKGIDVSSW